MNASELARNLHEERDILIESIKRPTSKGVKQMMLNRVREIERELDIPSENYNDPTF